MGKLANFKHRLLALFILLSTKVTHADEAFKSAGKVAGKALNDIQSIQDIEQKKNFWTMVFIATGVVFAYLSLRLTLGNFLKNIEKRILFFLGIRSNSHNTRIEDYNYYTRSKQETLPAKESTSKEPSIRKFQQSIKAKHQENKDEVIESWNQNSKELNTFLFFKPWLVSNVLFNFKAGSQQLDFTIWLASRLEKKARTILKNLAEIPENSSSAKTWDLSSSRVHFDFLLSQVRLAERKEMRIWRSIVEEKDINFLLAQQSERLFMSFAKLSSLNSYSVFSRCCPIERLQSIAAKLATVRKIEKTFLEPPEMKNANQALKSLCNYLKTPSSADKART